MCELKLSCKIKINRNWINKKVKKVYCYINNVVLKL